MKSRQAVYAAIDTERQYQNSLSPARTDGEQRTVGDYLTMLRHYLTRAEAAWTENPGNIHALHEIRKVSAIGVRCMEEHGAPYRGERI
jgi:hypothetical protein